MAAQSIAGADTTRVGQRPCHYLHKYEIAVLSFEVSRAAELKSFFKESCSGANKLESLVFPNIRIYFLEVPVNNVRDQIIQTTLRSLLDDEYIRGFHHSPWVSSSLVCHLEPSVGRQQA